METEAAETRVVNINFQAPAEVADALKERAALEDRSVSAVIRRAVAEYLAKEIA